MKKSVKISIFISIFVLIIAGSFFYWQKNEKTLDNKNQVLKNETKNVDINKDATDSQVNEKNDKLVLIGIADKKLEKELLSKMFNSDRFVSQDLAWKPTESEIAQHKDLVSIMSDPGEQPDAIPSGYVITSPVFSYIVKDTGVEYAYVFAQTAVSDCHACGAYLAGGIFKKDGNDWIAIFVDRFIDNVGSYGKIGKISEYKIGPNKVGFVLKESDEGQGYYSENMTIYYFNGQKLANIFTLTNLEGERLYNCDQSDDANLSKVLWETKVQIENVVASNSQYYDLIATTTGSQREKEGSCKIVSANKKIEKFVWKGDGFVLDGGKIDSNSEGRSLPKGYTLESYKIEKVQDIACQKDEECKTPVEYLIRSNCPYTSLCLDKKCSVVCPSYK